MARICLDYGHGGVDSGAVYNGRLEKEDNLSLGLEVADELRRHGVTVVETRVEDKFVSLKERVDIERKGNFDYFISFHRNACKPEKAKGAETYVYIIGREKSIELADKIQKALIRVGFTNGGVKKANFYVLRETKAPAVLIEVGFIDSLEDNKIFDTKKIEISKVIAKAILEQLNIKYVETPQTIYRVVVGCFTSKENAKKQVDRLKDAGFDVFIDETK